MTRYGQFCPVARALEILGDRWSLLIIRDLLLGTRHFNDLERGLPGISRGLLSKRLKQMQKAGIIQKINRPAGRRTTEYQLTEAGRALESVLDALLIWGTNWAFGDPTPAEQDSALLMWWLRRGVRHDRLPEERVVVRFDFFGAERATYWLVLSRRDSTLCLTDPGYDLNLLVSADLAAFYNLWAGRIDYRQALASEQVKIEGLPGLQRSFPDWFTWSAAAPLVRLAQKPA